MERDEIEQLIEEEAFLIKHSGETPEIAYHSSLYFLFEDPEGPGLKKDEVNLYPLKEAVFKRYVKILLRDLKPTNRDKRIYRGIARSIANFERLKRFAQKENFPMDEVIGQTKEHLLNFLKVESHEVSQGLRSSCINCTFKELVQFAKILGIEESELPNNIKKLCLKS